MTSGLAGETEVVAADGGRPVLRFAPSPNGLLHLGHAYSALMNSRLAARLGGVLRLRFEDIDRARCRPAFAAAALDDLAWLGVPWSGALWRQSERFAAYRAALRALEDEGLVYPCFCSRGDIVRAVAGRPGWPHDPDGSPLYPGTCRALPETERRRRRAAGQPAGLRLDMGRALARSAPDLHWTEFREGETPARVPAEVDRWGDVLLARKDVPTSYHLSVVVDDAAQGIGHVVRGEDLFHATGLHRLLQQLLGYAAPVYHHHRLIRDPQGSKLSKSLGASSLQGLRRAGASQADILGRLGLASIADDVLPGR